MFYMMNRQQVILTYLSKYGSIHVRHTTVAQLQSVREHTQAIWFQFELLNSIKRVQKSERFISSYTDWSQAPPIFTFLNAVKYQKEMIKSWPIMYMIHLLEVKITNHQNDFAWQLFHFFIFYLFFCWEGGLAFQIK